MHNLSITVKIWLSVAVFILGYTISVSLGQVQNLGTRTSLRTASEGLFPAAQQAQMAVSEFQSEQSELQSAVVTQDPTGIDKAVTEGNQAVAAIRSVASVPGIPAERGKQAAALASTLEQLLADSQTVYHAVMSGSMSPEMQQQMRALAERNNQATKALADFKEQSAADLRERLSGLGEESASQGRSGLILFLITMAIAGAVVHLTIQRSISRPVGAAVAQLAEGAAQILSAAAQVSSSSQSLAQGASEQTATIEETSSAAVEINAMANRNREHSHTAAAAVTRSRDGFEKANRSLAEMVDAMQGIHASSQKISKIIKVIDEIAFQTNILALNAAVEAARAGEAGMGFAVVADEVRNLAQRCAQAAKDTEGLIAESMQRSQSGKTKVDQVAVALGAITADALEVKVLVEEINQGSVEQTGGIEQISRAISQVEQVTQSSAANAEESAAAAQELNAQAGMLKDVVEQLQKMVNGGHGGERAARSLLPAGAGWKGAQGIA